MKFKFIKIRFEKLQKKNLIYFDFLKKLIQLNFKKIKNTAIFFIEKRIKSTFNKFVVKHC